MITSQNIKEKSNPHTYTKQILDSKLSYEDGDPLETQWHLDAMHLLTRIIRYYYLQQGDVFVGGNMFVYFDPDQQKNKNFYNPDLFLVKGVSDLRPRNSWVVWEEGFLTPNVVVELLSPSMDNLDLIGKKNVYEQILHAPEYVVYNPNKRQLKGWRLIAGQYQSIQPNEKGWLWLTELDLWLGLADYTIIPNTPPLPVLRVFDKNGNLIPSPTDTESQQAIIERLRAEEAREQTKQAQLLAEKLKKRATAAEKRADTAELEIARLKALLEKKRQTS
ncbi:Uma2 family endonuclease [Anaerolineales bacterium HSG6]|nr:Uma2 family endonuclease [Anaerolineales bacterium HSG6]